MSKKAIALAGLALLGTIGAARAADVIPGISRPYAAPAPAYAAYNWMGFYIGGNLGYQWGDIAPDRTQRRRLRPAGGIQLAIWPAGVRR